MKKSYLITGGYGLIGSALANNLDGKITILTRSNTHQNRISKKGVKVIKKDLLEIKPRDLSGIDIVYHCASTVDNYNILTNPFIDVETNIIGTIKLLEACKDLNNKPKLIFFSTFFVYGNSFTKYKKAITEYSHTDPLAIYPATKLCTESIIKLYSQLYKIPYLICRLTNVYGDQEDFNNKKKGALNYIIMQAIKGETLNVYKGGNFKRDYIYIDDVVSAIQFLEKRNISNDTFLIGLGKPVLFRNIINYLLKITGNKSKITEIEPPKFHKVVGITDFVANTSKINKLGWKAKISYQAGLRKIVKTYQNLVSIY